MSVFLFGECSLSRFRLHYFRQNQKQMQTDGCSQLNKDISPRERSFISSLFMISTGSLSANKLNRHFHFVFCLLTCITYGLFFIQIITTFSHDTIIRVRTLTTDAVSPVARIELLNEVSFHQLVHHSYGSS